VTWRQKLVNIFSLFNDTHLRLFVSVILAVFIIISVGASYWWYTSYNDKQASYALLGAVEDFEQLSMRDSGAVDTAIGLEDAFFAGAQRYRGTTFAPLFEAFASEIQLRKGHMQEALATLQDAMKHFSVTSPFYYVYATKVALMKLDSTDETVRNEGHKELALLADATNNPQRDMAQYYQGYVAWAAGQREQAKALWSQLQTVEKPSEWSRLAQSKLALLTTSHET
jgi:hypothetical protein